METIQIDIAIVDDHTLFRNGLAALLREFKELNVVFEAENGRELQLKLTRHLTPKVILMDINMPVMDGYESTLWLKEKYPHVHILALSMFEDDKAVLRMIRCGAGGYMLKESRPRDLVEAVKILNEKGIYINDLVTGKLFRSASVKEEVQKLSGKELEFLKYCCSELTYKEIADQMYVSPRTTDNYREALFAKLGIKSRTGLVLYAIKNEIFKP